MPTRLAEDFTAGPLTLGAGEHYNLISEQLSDFNKSLTVALEREGTLVNKFLQDILHIT